MRSAKVLAVKSARERRRGWGGFKAISRKLGVRFSGAEQKDHGFLDVQCPTQARALYPLLAHLLRLRGVFEVIFDVWVYPGSVIGVGERNRYLFLPVGRRERERVGERERERERKG